MPASGDRRSVERGGRDAQASDFQGGVMPAVLLDAAGRPRSPATLPGFHTGRPPRNKGQRYPADPPTVAEIVAVMRHAGSGLHAARLRALIVVLWRAGLRIHEALASAKPTSTRAAARCSCGEARAVAAARSAWTTGPGSSVISGSRRARTYRSVRSCVSPPGRHPVVRGRPAPRAPDFVTPPHGPACAAASHHISFATHTPSRWPAKASR